MRLWVIAVLMLVSTLFVLQAEAAGLVDNGDGTVTDDKTGLMWQKQDDGKQYNWYQASGTYYKKYNPTSENVCRSLTLGGKSDWRLPSKRELETILAYFWNTASGGWYWSSAMFVKEDDVYASYANLVDGKIFETLIEGPIRPELLMPLQVKCVRGGM